TSHHSVPPHQACDDDYNRGRSYQSQMLLVSRQLHRSSPFRLYQAWHGAHPNQNQRLHLPPHPTGLLSPYDLTPEYAVLRITSTQSLDRLLQRPTQRECVSQEPPASSS